MIKTTSLARWSVWQATTCSRSLLALARCERYPGFGPTAACACPGNRPASGNLSFTFRHLARLMRCSRLCKKV